MHMLQDTHLIGQPVTTSHNITCVCRSAALCDAVSSKSVDDLAAFLFLKALSMVN